MSDMIDTFRAMKELRKLERQKFGVECPVCLENLPRANPKLLLPGQSCRAHKPHYRDQRPTVTDEQFDAEMAGTGWSSAKANPHAD